MREIVIELTNRFVWLFSCLEGWILFIAISAAIIYFLRFKIFHLVYSAFLLWYMFSVTEYKLYQYKATGIFIIYIYSMWFLEEIYSKRRLNGKE